MLLVDVERGRVDGIAMAKELDDGKGKGTERAAGDRDGERTTLASTEDEARDSDHESEHG